MYIANESDRTSSVNRVARNNAENDDVLKAIEGLRESLDTHIRSTSDQFQEQGMQPYGQFQNSENDRDGDSRYSTLAIEWFENNYMKLNEGKCHLLVSGFKHEVLWANIAGKRIWESTENKLLGLHIDKDLQFTSHVSKLCTQAGQKLTAISRIAKFMSLEKRKLVINSFFMSQFQYFPLTWMFHSRALNNRINDLHYRALRLIYQEDTMTFKEFLEKDGAVTIHHRNI